ncbi:hypothetical protein DVT68_13195 [Dyella solisilvae]|uniref:Cyclodeaminase/cyclohydrolase domain-containing protein n=1 Tax=Dyella solisilvae TaxID=1920168 RepID=A0A370K5V7_9GAMM|nr:hypothetical protein [Dyella solisilvae]RDI98035.1 hypothetical protein DVT68_13195 [Dyella solisilvae]
MQTERTEAVPYALTVARACAELAADAINDGALPTQLAATLSAAAKGAADRLDRFLCAKGESLSTDARRLLLNAQMDLEAVAQIAGLVVTNHLTPRNATCVAMSARYTAEQAVKHLKHAEEELGD